MKVLITGGCGFLGSNLAAEILKRGDDLIVFDSLFRFGSSFNLEWLRSMGVDFNFIHGDIRNVNDVEQVIKNLRPDAIYHLAGQVAMTTSISDPRMDFEVNVVGSFNVLNAVRLYCPETIIVYSSTNKVYGDLEQFQYKELNSRYECIECPNGFDERVQLNFHSPYGVSKGSADQYMLDFSRIYGLNTIVFRHSSMFGGRQFATADQGWVGWFVEKALMIKQGTESEPFTISGNGKQVRDLLYVSDVVELYLLATRQVEKIKGQAFNVGGGVRNSCSLLELFSFLELELSIQMNYREIPTRESDQKIFIADMTKIKQFIGWEPVVGKDEGIRKMIDWQSS